MNEMWDHTDDEPHEHEPLGTLVDVEHEEALEDDEGWRSCKPAELKSQLVGDLSRETSNLSNTHATVPSTPPKGGQLLGLYSSSTATKSTPLTPPSKAVGGEVAQSPPRQHDGKKLPVVVCGPMGAGKTALLSRLIAECKEEVRQCVSHVAPDESTKANPHAHKKDALGNYKSIPYEQFQEMEKKGEFIEVFKDQQRGVLYGIRHGDVRDLQEQGFIPMIDIDQRALETFLDKKVPARYVYLVPPSKAELSNRLSAAKQMKSVTQKEVTTALAEYDKKAEVIARLEEATAGTEDLLLVENADYDGAYMTLKKFVLEGHRLTAEQVKSLLVQPKPLLGVTIIVEPSGIGGSRFIDKVRSEVEAGFAVSHTTRDPKPGEVNGRHYHFVDRTQFRTMFTQNEFLEFAHVGGNYYGITKTEFKRALSEHERVVIKMNVHGARSVKSVQIGARFVLLYHSSIFSPEAKAQRRERWRSKEGAQKMTDSEIARRETVLREEMAEANDLPFYFDSIVDVKDEAKAYEQLVRFIQTASSSQDRVLHSGKERVPPAEADDIIIRRTGALRAGTAMKADHFPSGKQRGLPEEIEGAPNFRQVAFGPDPYQTGSHSFFGMAQPTLNGFRRALMRATMSKSQSIRTLVVNLREERVLYINGKPFCLKNFRDLYHNTEEELYLESSYIEAQEDGLKSAIIQESQKCDGNFLVHDEDYAAGEIAAHGEVFAYYEKIQEKSTVLTTRQVVSYLTKTEKYNVHYIRVPITDEKPPKDEDLDTLTKEFWKLHMESPASPILFNCQLGRGRTTTATLICLLFLFPPSKKKFVPSPDTAAFDDASFVSSNGSAPPPPVPSSAPSAERGGDDAAASGYVERWDCVRTLFKEKNVPWEMEQHFHNIIEATSHIQNLRKCVDESIEKCASCDMAENPDRKRKLWKKVENYLKRYYYLAMAAAYCHTECTGDYKRWREAIFEAPPAAPAPAGGVRAAGTPPHSLLSSPPHSALQFSSDAMPGTPVSPTAPLSDGGSASGGSFGVGSAAKKACSDGDDLSPSESEKARTKYVEPMRVSFKLWVSGSNLWERCTDELLKLKCSMGLETPGLDEKAHHTGQVCAVDEAKQLLWIRAPTLHEEVYMTVANLRATRAGTASTPTVRLKEACPLSGPPPLTLTSSYGEPPPPPSSDDASPPPPAAATATSATAAATDTELRNLIGTKVTFRLRGGESSRLDVGLPIVLTNPSTPPTTFLSLQNMPPSPPLSSCSAHCDNVSAGGHSHHDSAGPLSPSATSSPTLAAGWAIPPAAKRSGCGGADAGLTHVTSLPRLDIGVAALPQQPLQAVQSPSVQPQAPTSDAVYYQAGCWHSFSAAYILYSASPASPQFIPISPEEEAQTAAFIQAIELHAGPLDEDGTQRGCERADSAENAPCSHKSECPKWPQPAASAASAAAAAEDSKSPNSRRCRTTVRGSFTSPTGPRGKLGGAGAGGGGGSKKHGQAKIVIVGRVLADALAARNILLLDKVTSFVEDPMAEEVVRRESLMSIWEGPSLVSIAWKYVGKKFPKTVPWVSLPAFLSYIAAMSKPDSAPSEVRMFSEGLMKSLDIPPFVATDKLEMFENIVTDDAMVNILIEKGRAERLIEPSGPSSESATFT